MATKTLTHESEGQYGLCYTRTLCWDEDTMLGVLVEDNYCGRDSLEGGTYRPYIYHLTPDLVRSAIDAWDAHYTVRMGANDWASWWYDNCHREELSGDHATRRYYGKAEDALARYLARQSRGPIAANIDLVMRVRGVSQTDLGQRLGVSQAYVGQLLAAPHAKLSEAAVGRVAEALGVPVEWLEDPGLAGKTVEELRGD